MTEKGGSKLIGCKVRIKTIDGEYEGIVKSVYGELTKILIYKVVVIPGNKPVVGPLTFYGKEILSCQVVEPKHDIQRANLTNARKVILPKLPFGELATGDDTSFGDELNQPEYRRFQSKFGKLWLNFGSEELSDGFDLDLDKPKIQHQLPDKYFIIDTINEALHNSIKEIKSHRVIGIHIEGASMGRLGEICLLNIATVDSIFLFDIIELGKDAFAAGLKDILEDMSINKVFHDSRLASDILFHQYSVTLKNVSDTQVIDIMQRRYYHKNLQLPEYVRSMSVLLKQFLELEEEYISFNLTGFSRMMNDVMSWQVRPLPLNHRIYTISNVLYLCVLYDVLMDKFLNDIKRGNEIYLSLVRDNEDANLALQLANNISLPYKIGEMFGQPLKFYRNFKPKEQEFSCNIWDKERLLEGTNRTPDEIVKFCLKGVKASDFKMNPEESEELESRPTNTAFPYYSASNDSPDRSGSDEIYLSSCKRKGSKRNLPNKSQIIPSGMEGNVRN